MEKLKLNFLGVLIISLAIVFLPSFGLASSTNGTIDSTYKYAWGENTGWINFGATNSNVAVTDATITGYAWSDNYGWINLAPFGSGVTNNNEGTLFGYAWGENTGWINFLGVTIDNSGYFSGYANGTTTGQISFTCHNTATCETSDFKLRTDWRPASERSPVGGGVSGWLNLPSNPSPTTDNPSGDFKVIINNGETTTRNREVILKFFAGDNTENMAISERIDFQGISLEKYQPTKSYLLSEGNEEKTIYVKFYTPYGQSSPIASDSIVLESQQTGATSNQVFTKTLGYDSKGEEVRSLQEFLSQYSDIYPEGLITGYFGPLTQRAVEKFQCKYDIICSGTPNTTGYGLVGPRTRDKWDELRNSFRDTEEKVVAVLQSQIKLLQEQLIQILSQLAQILRSQIQEDIN